MRKYLLVFTILVILVVLQQNGIFWKPPPSSQALQGIVRATNNQTLPDKIYVFATWLAETGMSSRHCVHMDVTTADSDGRWAFPMWQDWRHNRRAVLFIEIYSPGQLAVAESIAQNRWQIEKHEGTALDYLNYLGKLRVYCGAIDGSRMKGLAVWSAILRDVIQLKGNTKALSEAEALQIESLSWDFSKKVVDPVFQLSGSARDNQAIRLIQSIEDSTQ